MTSYYLSRRGGVVGGFWVDHMVSGGVEGYQSLPTEYRGRNYRKLNSNQLPMRKESYEYNKRVKGGLDDFDRNKTKIIRTLLSPPSLPPSLALHARNGDRPWETEEKRANTKNTKTNNHATAETTTKTNIINIKRHVPCFIGLGLD